MRAFKILVLMVACCVAATGCRKVKGTGRSQLVLTSASYENSLGAKAYSDILKKEKRCNDPEIVEMVNRVGKRLAANAPDEGFKYEFNVIESKQANAFCLPGGKVAIYTGILHYCQNEAGLATVMGHEIAHAIARHGGERMTQGILVQGVATGVSAVLKSKGVSPTTQNIAMTAFGAGSQIGVLLPFSRKHELEADELGMRYMAKAGYDPHEAVKFWSRFGGKGKAPPSWLSTHPHCEHRAKELNSQLKRALRLYAKSPQYGLGAPIPQRYMKR